MWAGDLCHTIGIAAIAWAHLLLQPPYDVTAKAMQSQVVPAIRTLSEPRFINNTVLQLQWHYCLRHELALTGRANY